MLQSLSPEIAKCYERARDSRQRAETARDDAVRELHLNMERRWLLLARSHEVQARLSGYSEEARRKLRAFTPLHPAIPRVMCPDCGTHMRLERIEPSAQTNRRADVVTFACRCSFVLRQTIDRVD